MTVSDLINNFENTVGVAGVAKYGFQATRAAQGLSTTTPLTAVLDIAGGTSAIIHPGTINEAVKGAATASKGITGAARFSTLTQAASFASKAAPIVARGSAILGTALGAYEVGKGIQKFQQGKTEEGQDQIIDGSADIVTSVALGVAVTSSATVVGVPVAAVALGIAGIAQGIKYRHEITAGADFVGDKMAEGATVISKGISSGFDSIKHAFNPN